MKLESNDHSYCHVYMHTAFASYALSKLLVIYFPREIVIYSRRHLKAVECHFVVPILSGFPRSVQGVSGMTVAMTQRRRGLRGVASGFFLVAIKMAS